MGKYFNPRKKASRRYNNKENINKKNEQISSKHLLVEKGENSTHSGATIECERERVNSFGKYKQFLSTPLVKTCYTTKNFHFCWPYCILCMETKNKGGNCKT